MSEAKTKATTASVEAYLSGIEDESRREDCRAIMALMSRVTKQKPVMWGSGIVGFGSYHYRYDSGRKGDACITGFSSRKSDISIYLVAEGPERRALLAKLGKHRIGKSCLHIRRLGEVDGEVLEELIASSLAEVRRRYPQCDG